VLSLATALPYYLGLGLTGTAPFSSGWLSLSPAYAGWLLFQLFATGGAGFWPAAGSTFIWALVCLLLSACLLKRKWSYAEQEEAAGAAQWQRVARGGAVLGRKLKKQLLQFNPFQWLVQRDTRLVRIAWLSVAAVCAVWLLGWLAWPRYWPSTINFFLTALIMAMTVDVIQLHATARPLAESRRDGTLELLLTTPLSPEEILDGQTAAIKAQFWPLRLFLLGLFVAMICAGYTTRTWTFQAACSYLAIWGIFLFWSLRGHRRTGPTAMWIALNTGRPSYSVYRAQGSPWHWVWLFFNLRHLRSWTRSAVNFPSGSVGELVIVSMILMIVLLVAAFGWKVPVKMRTLFIQHFRSVAQKPLPEAGDPRLKKWKDISEPLESTQPLIASTG
jgi:hypothetical protein